MMCEMDSETWVMDVNDKFIEFAPIWPKDYTNDVLFLDVSKSLLTSATVCGKTCEMLGVDPDINTVMEFPHSFPVKNRQLIHIPTVRMNIHATKLDIREWTRRIDQILRNRLDRKGIIHTVSYERRNHVIAQSRYSEHMMTHQTKDAIKMVHRFKEADPPAILVSPSMTTGWDFPYDDCEFQIIGKLAYPDTRNKIVKARVKEDPDYGAYVAMQQLVQACGRAVRAKDDHSENFIIDDNIRWFVKKFKAFAPKWFLESYRSTTTIPKPPRRINHGE
jgi:Rad3-related DNA helicase